MTDHLAQPDEPLAPGARQRIATLTTRLELEHDPGDLRDLGVAIASLAVSLDTLEDLDGRLYLNRKLVEDRLAGLRALLELVGVPPDDDDDLVPSRDQYRARVEPYARLFYDVREGLLDDLHHALRPRDAEGYEPAELDERPGLFAQVLELESELRVAYGILERREERIAELEAGAPPAPAPDLERAAAELYEEFDGGAWDAATPPVRDRYLAAARQAIAAAAGASA